MSVQRGFVYLASWRRKVGGRVFSFFGLGLYLDIDLHSQVVGGKQPSTYPWNGIT